MKFFLQKDTDVAHNVQRIWPRNSQEIFRYRRFLLSCFNFNMIFIFGFADYIAEIATKGTYAVSQ